MISTCSQHECCTKFNTAGATTRIIQGSEAIRLWFQIAYIRIVAKTAAEVSRIVARSDCASYLLVPEEQELEQSI